MRIALVTSGTRGDVQPVMVLAGGLVNAGHEVTVCGPPNAAREATNQAYRFVGVGNDMEEFAARIPDPVRRPVAAAYALQECMRQDTHSHFAALPDIVRGHDVVVGASLAVATVSVAEAAGVPFGFLLFCPQLFRSRHHPPLFVRDHARGKRANAALWWIHTTLFNAGLKGVYNRERQRLGLRPIQDLWCCHMGTRIIAAWDRALAPVPDDVGAQCDQVGYLRLPATGALDAKLLAFLEAGPPPIYIGFSSMMEENPDATTELIRQAVGVANVRVVLGRGWAGLGQGDLGDNVFCTADVPHALLFPHMAGVVHHGGAGTTAYAARAGVPQLVVPHVSDQFYWAQRVGVRALGPPAMWRNTLTATTLATALTRLISSPRFNDNARVLAAELASQDSLAQAVRAVQRLADPPHRRLAVAQSPTRPRSCRHRPLRAPGAPRPQ